MKKETIKKDSSAAKLVTVGAGLAGLAATAYFFLGPKGKKNQKEAKDWATKMKNDVIKELKSAQKVTEPVYQKIIDSVASKHEKIMNVDSKEIKALADDLKKHWKTISGSIAISTIKPAVKKAATTVKKTTVKKTAPLKKPAPITKKVIKKTTKKTVKK